MLWRRLALAGLVIPAVVCGSQDVREAAVTVTIREPVEMPFHGPTGPGTEPIYIDFRWTVVVTASDGAACQIGMVRSRVAEQATGSVLTAEGGPLGTLSGGGALQLAQEATGLFPSTLYPGDWRGTTTVDVVHESGERAVVSATFAFR